MDDNNYPPKTLRDIEESGGSDDNINYMRENKEEDGAKKKRKGGKSGKALDGATKLAEAAGQPEIAAITKAASFALKHKETIKKVGIALVSGIIVLIILIALFITGSLRLISEKEALAKIVFGPGAAAMIDAVKQNVVASTFTNPDECTEAPIICSYYTGVSNEQIARFRENPRVVLEDSDIAIAPSGRKYLKQLRVKESGGTPSLFGWMTGKASANNLITVSASNFSSLYGTNADVTAVYEQGSNVQAIFWRSSQAVQRLASAGITRTNILGDETDPVKLEEKIRNYIYGVSLTGDATIPGTSDFATQFNTGVQTEAAAIRTESMTDGPAADTLVSASGLSQGYDAIVNMASSIIQGIQGFFNNLIGTFDSANACDIYNLTMVNNYEAKKIKAQNQMRGTMLKMTQGDAQKMGKVNSDQLSYIYGTEDQLTDDGRSRTSSGAMGLLALGSGGVDDTEDLARFSVATPNLAGFTDLATFFQDKLGSDPATECQQPTNLFEWFSKVFSNILSGQTTSPEEAAIALQLAENSTPQAVQNKSGAAVPDNINDPDGGLAGTDNDYTGALALSEFLYRSDGFRPYTEEELPARLEESQAAIRVINRAYAINTGDYYKDFREKSYFALLPMTDGVKRLDVGDTLSAVASIVSGSGGRLLSNASPAYAASTSINYRPDLNNDAIQKSLGYATTYSGSVLMGDDLTGRFQDSLKLLVEAGWMTADGVMTPETTALKQQCIDGSDPLVATVSDYASIGKTPEIRCSFLGSKADATASGSVLTGSAVYSTSDSNLIQALRVYVRQQNIKDARTAMENGTLGANPFLGSGSSASGVTAASGSAAELAQKLLDCRPNITIRTSAWLSNGVSPLQQLENLAAGKASIPGYQYSFNPALMSVLAGLCEKYSFEIGSSVRTQQTSGGSIHPYGLAVDLNPICDRTPNSLYTCYKDFLKDAEALFKAGGAKCSFLVDSRISIASIESFTSYCRVGHDPNGDHLHMALSSDTTRLEIK